MTRIDLIVFDFDGVVADSELLANTLLSEYLTRSGKPTTVDDSIRLFMGKRMIDTRVAAEAWLGHPLPSDFETDYRDTTRERMRSEVQPVSGVAEFLQFTDAVSRCVASSSMHGWLDHCVDTFGFRGHFGRNLFSATEVANGKPAPDIFLHAASRMGVAPNRVTARPGFKALRRPVWKRSVFLAAVISAAGTRKSSQRPARTGARATMRRSQIASGHG